MEVINQLRTNGKITEGEFNFMNDQAGRAQDSADAGMEKTAKSTMQKAMEQIEAIKAAAAVQKLDISVSINDQQALQDMDSMINRIQQAATAKPVKIAVELVGPDGKYRTDARSDWLPSSCPKSSPMPKAVPFLAPVPAPRTASQLAEQWGIRGQGRRHQLLRPRPAAGHQPDAPATLCCRWRCWPTAGSEPGNVHCAIPAARHRQCCHGPVW
jgi:hypothetical protein